MLRWQDVLFPPFFGTSTSCRILRSLSVKNNLQPRGRSTFVLVPWPQLGASVELWYVPTQRENCVGILTHHWSIFLQRPSTESLTTGLWFFPSEYQLLWVKPILSHPSVTFYPPLVIVLSIFPFTGKLLQRLSAPFLHFFTSQPSFTIQHMVMAFCSSNLSKFFC